MSKLTNEQIVERSRQELKAAVGGPWYYGPFSMRLFQWCPDEDGGGTKNFLNAVEDDDNRLFLNHAHENLAACHAEIDRLTKMVNAMRCCDNCKYGCVQRDVDEDCSLGKWWDGCGREETYEFWEWNGVE